MCACVVQVAEENGLEVMSQLESAQVSTRAPSEAVGGMQTLTTQEEDHLSSR